MALSFNQADSLEEAADLVANQIGVTLQVGPSPDVAAFIKSAFTQPNSVAQGLQFLWDPPTVTNASGTGVHTDPAWGTIGKTLLGAGIGAGAGGLMSVFDEKRRKNWLRNALMGGLLGAGVGGGLGAMYHYGTSLSEGDQPTSAIAKLNLLRKQQDDLIHAGQRVPDKLKADLAAAAQEVPGYGQGPASPPQDRFPSAVAHLASGNLPEWLQALPQLSPRTSDGLLLGSAGAATGAGIAGIRQQRAHNAMREYNSEMADHQTKVDQLRNRSAGQSIQEYLQSAPDSEVTDILGANGLGHKARILAATPAAERDGVAPHTTFPGAYHDPTHGTPEHAPGGPETIHPVLWNKLRSRGTRLPPTPIAPHGPEDHISPTTGGVIGAGVGFAIPQLLGGSFLDPRQPPSK